MEDGSISLCAVKCKNPAVRKYSWVGLEAKFLKQPSFSLPSLSAVSITRAG